MHYSFFLRRDLNNINHRELDYLLIATNNYVCQILNTKYPLVDQNSKMT